MGAIPQDRLKYFRKFYYEDKLSAPAIAKKLGVSLDAAYYFMRHNNLPRRDLAEQNRARFANKAPSFSLVADLNSADLELKTLGIALYWGEGYKAFGASCVDFANSNPEMICVFLEFLRKVCGIREDKLRVYLYCHANQNVNELINFWSKLTGIPARQFTKPYIRHEFRPEKEGKMKYGLIHVRYYDKKLLRVVLNWIGEYAQKYAQVVP